MAKKKTTKKKAAKKKVTKKKVTKKKVAKKTVAKKSPAKKVAKKKAPEKKAVVKKAAAKKSSVKISADKPLTKSEIIMGLSEDTGLTKNDVKALFEAMSGQIKKSLGRRGPGAYTIPGLLKLTVVRKPATKKRKGINPFTGEEAIFKAKPARNVVKGRPLKALKDMV